MMLNALDGRPLPIYGDGGNVRDWLHVDDHCAGILLVLARGRLGEKYNIGGGNERTNLEIVDRICDVVEQLRPAAGNAALKGARYRDLKTFVPDRPGHDRRYAIDATQDPRASWAGRRGTISRQGWPRRRAGMSSTATGASTSRPRTTESGLEASSLKSEI